MKLSKDSVSWYTPGFLLKLSKLNDVLIWVTLSLSSVLLGWYMDHSIQDLPPPLDVNDSYIITEKEKIIKQYV